MTARPADRPAPEGPLPILASLQSSRRVRIFAWVVAVLLHLPAVPQLRLFEGLFADRDTLIGGNQDAVIPIELEIDDDLVDPAAEPGGTQPEAPTTVELPPEPTSEPTPPAPGPSLDAGTPELPDAGPLDAPPELPDAGPPPDALAEPPDASPPDDAEPPDAGLDAGPDAELPDAGLDAGPDAELPDAGPPVVSTPDSDPIADAAAARELQRSPNVTIILVGQQLRLHPVGAKLGGLLTNIRQWRSFFRGSDIDPVRDIDTMVITAPELVRASGGVVAIMSFSSDFTKARSAVDALVKRQKGSWIDGAPVPAAKAKVEGGERIFALVEAKKQLYVLPASQEKDLSAVGKLDPPPGGLPYAVKLSMVYPHRPLSAIQGAPPLSKELTRMTMTVTTLASGDADVLIVFEVSKREALAEAKQSIQDYFDFIRAIDTAASLMGKGVGLPELRFESHERSRVSGGKASTKFIVEGKASLPESKLQRIFDLADQNLVRGR